MPPHQPLYLTQYQSTCFFNHKNEEFIHFRKLCSSLLYSSTGPAETGMELAFLRALLARRTDCSATIHETLLDDAKDQLGKNNNCLSKFADGEEQRICSSLLYSKFLLIDPNFMLELAEVNDLPTFV